MGKDYKERHLHIERRVTSVNAYVNCIFQIYEKDGYVKTSNLADAAYFFRGQSNAAWKCESTAHRKLRNHTIESLKEYHEKLIANARKYQHHYKNGRELHDLELLCELRHYGAATWLLDLTFDPLVALFLRARTLTMLTVLCTFSINRYSATNLLILVHLILMTNERRFQ